MKRLLRSLLARRGYVLWKRDFFRFGISPFVDIARLNTAWGRSVDVVFDVGANIGQFADQAREALPFAKIFSFEPHPRSFERLAGTQRDEQTFRYRLALSDVIGDVVFHEYGREGESSHLNSLVPDARFPTRFGYKSNQITVRSSTIDDFCTNQNIHQIDFLKIDVEGAELSVLKGAEGMLSRGKILAAYLEFNELMPEEGASGGSLMPMAHYLSNFGFRYACTYTDFLLSNSELHVVANALFVLPPAAGN